MKLRWAGLASLLGALGACSPSGGGAAIDLANQPRTRPGLWLETMTIDGQAHPPSPFCDPGHGVFPRGDPDCSQWRATRAPDGSLHLDAVCAKLGGTFTLHRRITGDLASAFVDDIESVGEAPNEPKHTMRLHVALRYQGACPPGVHAANAAGE